MKKINSNGEEYYYYYKKKVGRHKKRGRKKEKKPTSKRKRETWDYKIMRFDFKKQVSYVGQYHSLDEVNYAKKILEERNAEVKFPRKYTNNVRKSKEITEFKCEYVVLGRIRDTENETNVTLLRNEYGKFVKHFTTNKEWAVVDKFPCLVEETFWVYGYHPKTDRKTYEWILSNMAVAPSEESGTVIMVYVYLNKVIFKYDEDIAFVICKNESDAIRMYNMISEETKKIKNIIMAGSVITKSDRGKYFIDILLRKTGWPKRKITSKSTRS